MHLSALRSLSLLRLRTGHVASLIQSGQNRLQLQYLEMWQWKVLSKYFYYVFTVNGQRKLYSGSLSGFLSEPVALPGCMKHYFMVNFPERCVLSATASAKSTHHSDQCRHGAGQFSSKDNGETSCWCFQRANSSSPGLKASRHLVSGAVSSQTWLCLYWGSVEMVHNIFHQIPDATTKVLYPTSISVMCYRELYDLCWIRISLRASNIFNHLFSQCSPGDNALGGFIFMF